MDVARVESALERYRLEGPRGSGATGTVFPAHDIRLCRRVAIKVFAAGRLAHDGRRRLQEEALTLSRLSHTNVASILDFGLREEFDYIVTEFVPGRTLAAMIAEGPLDAGRVAALGAQLARGLAAAHEVGIIHRDVNPGNLRVTPDGVLKILGFGGAGGGDDLSAWSEGLAASGTIRYMAPERFRGTAATVAADLFSAGAVLYEMACGRPAFSDPQPARLIESIVACRPARPSAINPRVGVRLEQVILRALARRPSRRFATAVNMAESLEAIPGPAQESNTPSRSAVPPTARTASPAANRRSPAVNRDHRPAREVEFLIRD